jgi:hypothetical protein
MKYYGVIVDTATRTVQSIEGDHPYKPDVEEGGWFCTCRWFKAGPTDHDKLIGEYLALQYEVWVSEVFDKMNERGYKKLIAV